MNTSMSRRLSQILERELTNSQKVTFVAGKGEREEVRTERKEQAMYCAGGHPESSG